MILNLQKFNDDQYEGLNLRIPLWFYDINKDKLNPIFQELKITLENSLSFIHPDNQKNIFELENFESKRQLVNERIKAEKKSNESAEKYQNDLLSGNIFVTGQNRYTDTIEIDKGFTFILKNGEEIEFTEKEMVTSSYSLNSKFTNKAKEITSEIDWLKTSQQNMLSLLYHNLNGQNGFKVKIEDVTIGNFSSDIWNLRLTFSIRCVKYYFKKKSGKIFYRECNLEWSENENCYSFMNGTDMKSLYEYHESQCKFIKNK